MTHWNNAALFVFTWIVTSRRRVTDFWGFYRMIENRLIGAQTTGSPDRRPPVHRTADHRFAGPQTTGSPDANSSATGDTQRVLMSVSLRWIGLWPVSGPWAVGEAERRAGEGEKPAGGS